LPQPQESRQMHEEDELELLDEDFDFINEDFDFIDDSEFIEGLELTNGY
jgi:hypothetical protein